MRTFRTLGILALGGLTMTGCLLKDVGQTWYVEADGVVNWVVIESDVRSDAQSVFDRQNEELTYFLAVQRQDHPIARAFKELELSEVRTRILRGTAPYTVMTDAKAGRIDVLGQRLIQHLGLTGTSVLERDGEFWTWTLDVRDPHADDTSDRVSEDLNALIGDANGIKVVLGSGRFEEAKGFELSSDHRTATLINPEELVTNQQGTETNVVLKLRWKTVGR